MLCTCAYSCQLSVCFTKVSGGPLVFSTCAYSFLLSLCFSNLSGGPLLFSTCAYVLGSGKTRPMEQKFKIELLGQSYKTLKAL